MSTVRVRGSNITSEAVATSLRKTLGTRYEVTESLRSGVRLGTTSPSTSVHVRRNWLEQANVRICPSSESTELRVTSASTVTIGGILICRLTIVRKVHKALEQGIAHAAPDEGGQP
jgi:hypothetical protein